jgi:ribosome recycling factor
MSKAIESFENGIKCIRAGTVTSALIDTYKVAYHNQLLPIKQLAYTANNKGIVTIKPYDLSIMNSISKVLRDAGLNVYNFSKESLAVSVPAICGEEKKKVIARIRQLGEEAKIAIRNIRKNERNKLDDESRRELDKKLQKDTDNNIKLIDEIVENKIKVI